MVGYADYFDMSLGYIFVWMENPHGTHYESKVKIEKAYPEMDKFIEICFDPGSPMNEKLNETLRQMLKMVGHFPSVISLTRNSISKSIR